MCSEQSKLWSPSSRMSLAIHQPNVILNIVWLWQLEGVETGVERMRQNGGHEMRLRLDSAVGKNAPGARTRHSGEGTQRQRARPDSSMRRTDAHRWRIRIRREYART